MISGDTSFYYPCVTAVIYYITVFTIAEIARKVLDKFVHKSSSLYVFAIELIATAQMCTCVYENSVMVKYYGPMAFFFTVTSLLTVGSFMNRGAPTRLLVLLSAEAIGGYSAFRLARTLWYHTLSYSTVHFENFTNSACALNYKIAFPLVICFEIIGCFLLRIILPNLPLRGKSYTVSAVVAAFLSFALIYVGVPGLNPVVASSRLFGCEGLDTQWFIAVYWICPVFGWMAAAALEKSMVKKAPKKLKKKSN
nr:CBN-AQP-10 protein [Haemonchus contortus]